MATCCFFLDRIPPELRLMVYEKLLVAEEPIRGELIREGDRYGLNTAIFRANRQIYEEARTVFYGKNTFYITSRPRIDSVQERVEREGTASERSYQFDPPIQPRHLRLVRHLTIDLIYSPPNLSAETSSNKSQDSADEGAALYIDTVVTLLRTTNLHTLRLTASPSDSLSAKNSLATFFSCDKDHALAKALASLPNLTSIPLSFDFPDCYYHTTIKSTSLLTNSILLLACQVMFCHSQMRIAQMMKDFESGEIEILEDGRVTGKIERVEGAPKVDLEPLMRKWPKSGPGLREVVVKAKELEREMTLHELWLSRMS